jgi:hypothetical protein
MVVYCVKTPTPILWRLTKNEDYLDTLSRRAHLPPDEGHELKVENIGGKMKKVGGKEEPWGKWDIITNSNTSIVEAYRKEGAIRHWEIMRTVMPDAVWETW